MTTLVVNDAFTYLDVLSWSFEISGVPVTFVTPNAYLLSLCQSYFRFYSGSPTPISLPPKQPIRLYLRFADPSMDLKRFIPADAKLLAQQEVTTIWKASEQERYYFHFNFGNALFRVEPMRGQIIGIISPDALQWPHLMVNTYIFMTLMLALRWRGSYHLHTAAVVSPQQRLTLICGGQRAGKTTLTTALGVAGWYPISDDGVMLHLTSPSVVKVQAFRRDFHLAASLLRQWEALHDLEAQYFYNDRACVDGLKFFNAESFASTSFAQVDQIVFPQLTGQKESYLEAVSSSEALRYLIEQSMFFPLEHEHTQRQMSLLVALVKQASCYRLRTGTDIWENPYRAGEVLRNVK